MMTENEVFQKLLPLIREVTGARAEQVRMASCVMQDLGAESIDLLDLSFLIEESFGIGIEPDEFEKQAAGRMSGVPYEKDGYLTEAALAELRQALPEVPAEKLQPGLKKIELPSVLNVAVFVHIIQRKLAEKAQEINNA